MDKQQFAKVTPAELPKEPLVAEMEAWEKSHERPSKGNNRPQTVNDRLFNDAYFDLKGLGQEIRNHPNRQHSVVADKLGHLSIAEDAASSPVKKVEHLTSDQLLTAWANGQVRDWHPNLGMNTTETKTTYANGTIVEERSDHSGRVEQHLGNGVTAVHSWSRNVDNDRFDEVFDHKRLFTTSAQQAALKHDRIVAEDWYHSGWGGQLADGVRSFKEQASDSWSAIGDPRFNPLVRARQDAEDAVSKKVAQVWHALGR